MPMASAIALEFSGRHPGTAIIFDNLHMRHDTISDVLASNYIPQLAEFGSPDTIVRARTVP
jgi:hypothetical protein